MEAIIKFVTMLWPSENEENTHNWRRAMFVSTILISAILSFHITAAKGYLTFLGVPGFVTTTQVSQVNDELKAIENTVHAVLFAVYAPQIRAKVRERCEAATARDREAINKDLDRLLNEYEESTGKEFDIPRCGEV